MFSIYLYLIPLDMIKINELCIFLDKKIIELSHYFDNNAFILVHVTTSF